MPLFLCLWLLVSPLATAGENNPDGGEAAGKSDEPTTVEAFLSDLLDHETQGNTKLAPGHCGERAVTGILPSGDKSDLGVFGCLRILAPIDSVVALIRNLRPLTTNPRVIHFGRFSDPPVLSDLDSLFVDDEAYQWLKDCKVGDCEIKMPDRFIQTFHSKIDWTDPDARSEATHLARQLVLGYLQAYLDGGDDALGAYHDKKKPQNFARTFRVLLSESSYLTGNLPRVRRFLEEFPTRAKADSTVFFYWVKEDAGPKNVMTVHQVSTHRVRVAGTDGVVVVSKQLYASHYFRGGLEFLLILGDPDARGAVSYVVDLSYTRIDPPTGILAGVVRSKLEGQAKKVMAEKLETLARQVVALPGGR